MRLANMLMDSVLYDSCAILFWPNSVLLGLTFNPMGLGFLFVLVFLILLFLLGFSLQSKLPSSQSTICAKQSIEEWLWVTSSYLRRVVVKVALGKRRTKRYFKQPSEYVTFSLAK